MEDRELVGACLRGDTEAFSRLVERYKDAVYGLALSYTNDFDAAQDIAQESFIKAFLTLRTLSDPAKFGIWLRTITVNQCRMWLRGRRSHIPLDELDEREVLHSFPRPKTPSQIYEAEEIEKLVLDALAKLPERIRQAAVLFYIDGLSMKEIGEFLGISPSAVKQRVYRARKHLKEEMMGMIGEIFAGRRLPEDFTERTVEEALRRGQEYLKQRRWEEAREEFRKVVEALPDRPEGHLGIGLAVNGLVEEQKRPGGEVDPDLVREALEELSEAYRLGARDPDTVWTLADLYADTGRHRECAELLEEFYRRAEDPQHALEAGWRAASSYYMMGEYERAVQCHREVLGLVPRKAAPLHKRLETYYYGVSVSYYKVGLAEVWLRETEELMREMKDADLFQSFLYFRERGTMYCRLLGWYKEAVESAKEFLKIAEASDEGGMERRCWMNTMHCLLLEAYGHLKEEGQFEGTLRTALENVEAYEREWHRDLRERGEGKVKERFSQKEMSIDEFYRKYVSACYHNLGCACLHVGRSDTAVGLFRRALEVRDSSGTHLLLSAALLAQGDRNASLFHLKEAARLSPMGVLSGDLRWAFEQVKEFAPVREDEEFLKVISPKGEVSGKG